MVLLLGMSGQAAQAITTPTVPLGSLGLTLSLGDSNGGVAIYEPVIVGEKTSDPNVFLWADGTWTGSDTTITWSEVSGDLDPGVSGSWAITNNSLVTQIYTLSVVLPVLPVVPSSLMFGSSTLSASDANFDGSATLSSVTPFPVYNGLIDLAPVGAAALFADPYSLVAGPGDTVGATAS